MGDPSGWTGNLTGADWENSNPQRIKSEIMLINAGDYDRDFSMAIGDAFDPEEITPWELAAMCERCGLQKRLVAKTLTTMSENLLKAMDEHL